MRLEHRAGGADLILSALYMELHSRFNKLPAAAVAGLTLLPRYFNQFISPVLPAFFNLFHGLKPFLAGVDPYSHASAQACILLAPGSDKHPTVEVFHDVGFVIAMTLFPSDTYFFMFLCHFLIYLTFRRCQTLKPGLSAHSCKVLALIFP